MTPLQSDAPSSSEPESSSSTTHFGFERVATEQKARRVAGVFTSVAAKYDVMNDVLSLGLHRVWKAFTIAQARLRPGMQVLDVAGGTGDLARAFAQRVGPSGRVVLTDINAAMLVAGRSRLLDDGLVLPVVQCDAERLPFAQGQFDRVCVAFGLRNMTDKQAALAQMRRVLRPGGMLLVLEFSHLWKPLVPFYDAYSFHVMPWIGARIAGDGDSYRYLAESIRMHPTQEALATMMKQAGLARVDWFNLAGGICALHVGYRI